MSNPEPGSHGSDEPSPGARPDQQWPPPAPPGEPVAAPGAEPTWPSTPQHGWPPAPQRHDLPQAGPPATADLTGQTGYPQPTEPASRYPVSSGGLHEPAPPATGTGAQPYGGAIPGAPGTVAGYPPGGVPGLYGSPAAQAGYGSGPVSGVPGGVPGQTGYGAGPVSGPSAPAGPGYGSGPGYYPSPTAAMPVVPGGPRRSAFRRLASVPVLAAIAAVLLLLTGVMTTLYVTRTGDNNRLSATLRDRNKTVGAQQDKIDSLGKQLQSTKDDLDAAQTKLQGSQNDTAEYRHQIEVISSCLTLLGQAGDAANRGDRATYNAKMTAAKPVCDEADKYLK